MIKPLIIYCLFLLVGCNGTIEEVGDQTVKAHEDESIEIDFDGIEKAVAVSSGRIEIFFYPAKGNSGSDDFIYLISVSDNLIPISVPQETLFQDYNGYLKYTIQGLEQGKDYIIKVDVKDSAQDDLIQKTENSSGIVKTFTHEVADFNGISGVSNSSGVEGLDSLVVKWPHASKTGSISNDPGDPIYYEVTFIDRNYLTPNDMNNTDFEESDGRYTRVVDYDEDKSQYTFRGFPSNTKFSVQVRAIHEDTISNPFDLSLRGEQNTNYLDIKTLDDDLSNIEFNKDSFKISNYPGEFANSTLKLNWESAAGIFDHYRIYYTFAENNLDVLSSELGNECSLVGGEISGTSVFCKKEDYESNLTLIKDLVPTQGYNFVLVICQTAECPEDRRVVVNSLIGVTATSVGNFLGIEEVRQATSLEQIGELYLRYTLPTFTNGFFDGLVIEYSNDSVEYSNSQLISESSYIGDLEVQSYNYITAGSITIKGVDYTSSNAYCFTIYPYINDGSGGKKMYPNGVWECVNIEIKGPTAESFAGLSSGVTSNNDIIIQWSTPGSGVFSHYVAYIKKTAGSFNFYDGIYENFENYDETNYSRILINKGDDEDTTYHRLLNLPDGDYQIGILTYYTRGAVETIRSEFNAGILSCSVREGESNVCSGGGVN